VAAGRKHGGSGADTLTDLSRLLCFLSLFGSFPGLTLHAQTLRLSSPAVSRGAPVSIEISLKSPKGKRPTAVQWEAIISTSELSLIDKDMAIGPAAQEAGKSVACQVKAQNGRTLTFACILAGGQQQIQNGVIALLRLRVSPEAPIGPTRVRVERGIAVSRDLVEARMKPVETVVSIRAK
jgi:hypothetical protein